MDQGAHFFRCDFQVHTPRDLQWKGSAYTDPNDRKAYAQKFIQACRDKGLNAVAITDHHDLYFFKYFREAAAAEKTPDGDAIDEHERITIFPGIELTLSIPCQAILILDADFPDHLLPSVLTVLNITPSEESKPKTAEVKRLDAITTFEKLKQVLDERDFLKGRYIILPNVTSGGSDTLLRKGVGDKYKDMPWVGGYLDGSISKCKEGDLNILDGKNAHYGNKRVALFQTSDSRSEDHKQLGFVSTWVKWSVPTAEALRQACLAQESRISQEEPQLPSIVIKSIHVSNSEFMGPVDLDLNSQYNALIGSRGTGKSTILEYLRWALCDEHQNESPNGADLQRGLVENTLSKYDATVEIHFDVNDVPHMVRRKSETKEILLKVGDGDLTECTPDDVRALLPIQAYSQKQLSRVGVRMDELDRFVRLGIKTELDSIASSIRSLTSKIRQIYSSVRRKQTITNSIREDRLNLESLNKQANAIRESLSGLTEQQQELISKQPLYLNAELLVDRWFDETEMVSESIADLNELLGSFPSEIDENLSELPDIKLLQELRAAIKTQGDLLRTLAQDAQKNIQTAFDVEEGFHGECKSLYDKWGKLKESFDEKYNNAKNAASSHQQQLENLADIEEKISEISKRIDRDLKEIEKLGTPEAEFNQLRGEWINQHKERGDLYAAQCSKLTELSDGAIKATAHKGSNTRDIEETLRVAIKGSGLRNQKIDNLLESILKSDDPIASWGEVLGELEALSQTSTEPEEQIELPETPRLFDFGFAKPDLIKLASKLTPETWLELVLTPMKDETTFEYKAKEGQYIPFEHASAGQQATALLFTLLNQSGPPLVIDQPEDDLDNQVISEIVDRLWKAKTRRQIIFSSHNANLVVNGDAELVVRCDYRISDDYSRGKIASQGAIDIPEIREAIKSVMEGGDKAFKLRLDKYGF